MKKGELAFAFLIFGGRAAVEKHIPPHRTANIIKDLVALLIESNRELLLTLLPLLNNQRF